MTPLPAARPSAFTTTGMSSRSFRYVDRRLGIAKHAVVGRRHVGVAQQVLAEDLAGFELGGGLRRAEGSQPGLLKRVDQAGGQGRLGADDREVDLVLLGERDELRHVGGRDVDVLGVARRARVARRDEHALDARTLADLPRQRVFATAVANNQESSSSDCNRTSRPCATQLNDAQCSDVGMRVCAQFRRSRCSERQLSRRRSTRIAQSSASANSDVSRTELRAQRHLIFTRTCSARRIIGIARWRCEVAKRRLTKSAAEQ